MPKSILISPFSQIKDSSPALGVAYLAAMLEKEGCIVKILSPFTEYQNLSVEDIKKEIQFFSPDFIGISLYTQNVLFSYRMLKELKKLKIPIVAGGYHPSIVPHEVLDNNVDIVVRGEGEETIVDLLKYFSGKINIKDIPGISYKDKSGDCCDNPDRPPIVDLDSISFPAKYLYENDDHVKHKRDYRKFGRLITSRGCPMNCTYCCNRLLHKYRCRSPHNVLEEILFIKQRYDIIDFLFFDALFTPANPENIITLCDLIIQERLKIKWRCTARLEFVTPELLFKMKEAGCYLVNYGIQSSNPQTLKRIKRHTDIGFIKQVLKWTKDAGIKADVDFMWGFPWESKDDISKNIEFLKEIYPYINLIMMEGIVLPFPGTELYENYKDQYGFEEWWLNPAKQYDYNPYLYQSISFKDGLLSDPIFNYSLAIKKEIKKAARYITKNNMKNYSFKRKLVFIIIIRISKLLSRIAPSIEINLFQPVLFKIRYIFKRPIF